MMIKVNDEYLDFDDTIEIERQIKLFQDVETSNGDYSYSFTLPKTTKNLTALGMPFPDAVKSIYQNVPCELIDNAGFSIHSGSLRIESMVEGISCSFFGGNNDWFSLLSSPMSDLPLLYRYDINLTESNIQASWLKNSGLVFPIIDTGTLVTRSFSNLKVEDFIGCFYAKTLFNEIFSAQGIKLQGDLINDSTFNKLIVASNGRSQEDIDKRSSYVNRTTTENTITTLTKVTFDDETTFPFFDGSLGNFTASTYTADVKMIANIELSIQAFYGVATGRIYLYKNGVALTSKVFGAVLGTDIVTVSISENLSLEAGDTIEVYVNRTGGVGVVGVYPNSTIRVTPTFIYRVFGKSSVPNWSQMDFVSNIIRIFNVLPSYNSQSRTLTLDLFNQIKSKTPIDISEDIETTGFDYSEFVSDYGRASVFSYQDSDDEDLREYNISNFFRYGSGVLTVNNDFIQDEADVVESDFTSPITYLNTVFDVSMERINFVELEEVDDKSITSVTDSSGTPRFNITDADDLFTVGDLVRLETNVTGYNGEWVISAVTSTYIVVNGLVYDSDATGTATLLRHQFTTDDNVYLFVNVSNIQNLFYSSIFSMMIQNTSFTSASLAYFNLLSNGREINAKYKQSLSFGSVNNSISYQNTILDTYWPIFGQILNDPVMLKVIAYFKTTKYSQLSTFLNPLRVKSNETNNLYYLNKITGYQSGHEPCRIELIKL